MLEGIQMIHIKKINKGIMNIAKLILKILIILKNIIINLILNLFF